MVLSPALLRQKRSQKRGLRLTVMLCGESGSGKSSFVNTLCRTNVIAPLDMLNNLPPHPETAHLDAGLRLDAMTVEIPDQGDGVLTLNIIDPVGFGQNLDNGPVFDEIVNYVEKQFDSVLAEESRIRRNPRFTDTRVHAILYFIQPTGHGLREPDIDFLQRLSPKANVIPVLAKADGLTAPELQLNKRLVMEDIRRLRIPVYGFPGGDGFQYEEVANGSKKSGPQSNGNSRRNSRMGVYDDLFEEDVLVDSEAEDEEVEEGREEEEDEDEDEFARVSRQAKKMVPFAVVGASDIDEHQGLLTRRYAWGAVDVEDARVSNVGLLRTVLTRTHVRDLRDTTEYVLYENYRTQKLSHELAEEGVSEAGGEEERSEASVVVGGDEAGGALLEREQQIWASEQRLKDTESKLARDVAARRAEIAAQEQELKRLELELLSKAAAMSLGRGRAAGSSQSIGY